MTRGSEISCSGAIGMQVPIQAIPHKRLSSRGLQQKAAPPQSQLMSDRDWDDLNYPYPPMIQAFEPATGQLVWRRSFHIRDISEMALAEGVLYFTDQSQLHAIDAYTGEDAWTLNVTDPLWYPPVVVGDYLFTGSVGRTYAVHIPTRTVVWQTPVAGQIVISDGWVLISGSDGTIRAFHASGGRLVAPRSLR